MEEDILLTEEFKNAYVDSLIDLVNRGWQVE